MASQVVFIMEEYNMLLQNILTKVFPTPLFLPQLPPKYIGFLKKDGLFFDNADNLH